MSVQALTWVGTIGSGRPAETRRPTPVVMRRYAVDIGGSPMMLAGAPERWPRASGGGDRSPLGAYVLAALCHVAVIAAIATAPRDRLPEPWKDGFTVALRFESAEPAIPAPDPPLAQSDPAPDPPLEPVAPVPETAAAPETPPAVAEVEVAPAATEPPAPASPVLTEDVALPPPPKPRRKPAHSAPVAVPTPPPAAASAGEAAGAPARETMAMAAPPAIPEQSITPPRAVAGRAGNPKPDYPADARRRRWQGDVVLRVSVSPTGLAEAIQVLSSSGHGLLDDAAATAVRKWRFDPATRGGAPVRAAVDVPIRFRLQED